MHGLLISIPPIPPMLIDEVVAAAAEVAVDEAMSMVVEVADMDIVMSDMLVSILVDLIDLIDSCSGTDGEGECRDKI